MKTIFDMELEEREAVKLDLYERYDEDFFGRLRILLHWVIEDKVFGTHGFCFAVVIGNDHYEIGVVRDEMSGYTPTMAHFKSRDREACKEKCASLNLVLFGMDEYQAFEMVTNSMRKVC